MSIKFQVKSKIKKYSSKKGQNERDKKKIEDIMNIKYG